jgi:tetratricopeptide (TPR) repeat protein
MPFVRAASVLFVLSAVACGGAETGQPAGATGAAESGKTAEETPLEPELTQEQLLDLYESAKTRVEAVTKISDESYASLDHDLRRVAAEAEAPALRANASLLLGSVAEQRGDPRTAISFYRQATTLLPEEASTHAVLAVALASDGQWTDAIASQWQVVERVPDDLQAWLLLGEMQIKGGDPDAATMTYTAYELRRKGLLDGLTLKADGEYVLDEANRIACANALAPAADNGTALALMYALDSDPAAGVRAAVAGVMGEQRLLGYQKLLETKLASETDESVKEVLRWAIDEITKDGIETAPGAVPADLAKAVEESAAKEAVDVGLAADEAKPGDAKPDDAKPDDAKPDDAKPDDAKPPTPAADPKPAG